MKRGLRHILVVLILCLVSGCMENGPTDQPYRIVTEYTVRDEEFKRTVGNLLGPGLVGENRITTLVNGDQIFPPMLDAIRSAQKTINFETYVWWSGGVGASFADALSDRAKNGVRVNVILDPIGSDRIDKQYIKQMREAGVNVLEYHRLRLMDPVGWVDRLNNRTHRKLLIVDGKVGFTGGVGLADVWLGNARNENEWRDNHYQVEGPIVWQLQAAFVDNWMEATGNVLHGDLYFPPIEPAGGQWAQVFRSSPDGGADSMQLMYLLSVAAARDTIRISSAYFVPDDLTVQTLVDARERGVRVQIIVPNEKRIDIPVVSPASRAQWGKLLKAGVEIYDYLPTMYHCKLLVVDDAWVSIGSANIDNRSFRHNDEANLNVLDADFAREQVRIFEADLQHSRRITYEMWNRRSMAKRATEAITAPFWWLM
jgi:cardiolipin synthase